MYKRTKVICTLGPATDGDGIVTQLVEAGMNVARFNFSHGSHGEHARRMQSVRKTEAALKVPIAVMLDTKGPEIRTGRLAGGKPLSLAKGDALTLCESDADGVGNRIHQSRAGLAAFLAVGDRILLDDGLIGTTVSAIDGADIVCTVENAGELGEHKSINVPDAESNVPFLTQQDESDLLFGIEQGIDFVAASFTRTADDIVQMKAFLADHGGADIDVIAKIENGQGIDNIVDILLVADGVMVARGDMGVEINPSQVPHIQKRIIRLCNEYHKPVITATQMLDSMIRNPRPTRAEVADVANAIYDGSDAVMLSGETANGAYPIEAVKMMAEIACASEPYLHAREADSSVYRNDVQRVSLAVGGAAVRTAEAIHAACIIVPTTSGRTGRLVSNLRPNMPIYAVAQNKKVLRQMQLLWGVTPLLGKIESASMHTVISVSRRAVVDAGLVQNGDLAVFTCGDKHTAPEPGISSHGTSAQTNVMYVVQIRPES